LPWQGPLRGTIFIGGRQAEISEVEVELFDPWEQRFKFEPWSRLYGHN
jgi:hypothetical protein